MLSALGYERIINNFIPFSLFFYCISNNIKYTNVFKYIERTFCCENFKAG